MFRNQHRVSWRTKAFVYAAASTSAGIVSGAALFIAGRLLSPTARLSAATLLALVGLVVAATAAARKGTQPIQCDRETPQAWMSYGPLRWAALNGSALGSGATTRLGFWLWYVIPVAAFLSEHIILSMAIYGAYGCTRAVAAYLLLWRARTQPGWDYRSWLLRQRARADVATTVTLGFVGGAVLLTLGF